MKKDLGVKPYLFPMPVLMIATYGENDKIDVMNMAWGGICDNNMVALNITESHKTSKNIKERKAFTISIADIDHLEESDFQFVIYTIRQTESECNANFEQVANMIIRLCDANLQLEQIEENEKVKNKELQKEIDTTQILKDGIENIKKKYSKIPFIGRKVTSILSAKMLNE